MELFIIISMAYIEEDGEIRSLIEVADMDFQFSYPVAPIWEETYIFGYPRS